MLWLVPQEEVLMLTLANTREGILHSMSSAQDYNYLHLSHSLERARRMNPTLI